MCGVCVEVESLRQDAHAITKKAHPKYEAKRRNVFMVYACDSNSAVRGSCIIRGLLDRGKSDGFGLLVFV